MRKNNPAGTPGQPAPMEARILELLGRSDYTPLNLSELGRRLGLQRSAERELRHVVAQLERRGEIARLKQGNRFGLPLEADLVPGRIRMNRQGVGTLQPTDP